MIEAAVVEFALTGLHGTSTETIARRAGVSQPYLFRLFGTKKELFLATVEHGFDRVEAALRAAAERAAEGRVLEAMGEAYVVLLSDREELLGQMQAYAACGETDVRALVRRRYADLYRFVEQASGANEDAVRSFFATGMLLNVAAVMDLPAIAGREGWAARYLGGAR